MNQLRVSPEELYFLAKMCDGESINYDYIAMMEDIGQRHAVAKEKQLESLVKKNYVTESMWGNDEVSEEVLGLLKPVFWGTAESLVEETEIGEPNIQRSIRFHWFDNQCVICVEEGRELVFSSLDNPADYLKKLAVNLMPGDYTEREAPKENDLNIDSARRLIVLKNATREGKAAIHVYYDYDGWICREETEEEYVLVSPKDFYEAVQHVLRGEV